MNPCPRESAEQVALFRWAAASKGKYPELGLMFHIPNGGTRDLREAHNLRLQGVQKGVPDIFLPAPKGEWHGLFIELKRRKGGKVSEEQRAWMDRLNRVGYKAVVCRGFEEAQEAIIEYLTFERSMAMEMVNFDNRFIPMNAGIYNVMPGIASDWLTHNTINRKLDDRLVRRYALDMVNGAFTLNPDAIAFDKDGRLVNGQHRLNAIVKADVAVPCLVVFDMPIGNEAFLNFDSGKNRTVYDRLYMAGRGDINRKAYEIATAYLRAKYGLFRASVSQQVAFIDANREIIDWAVKTANAGKHGVPGIYMVALIDAKLCGADDAAIQAFAAVYAKNDIDAAEGYAAKRAIELRESKLVRNHTRETVNVAKSKFNAFVNKPKRCDIRENLYPAKRLPLRAEDDA